MTFNNGILTACEATGEKEAEDMGLVSKTQYEELLERVAALEASFNGHTHSFSGSDSITDYYRNAYGISKDSSGSYYLTGGTLTSGSRTVSISGTTGGPSAAEE